MALKFRRGAAAQQSGSLIFGEPYINTDLNTLLIGGNGTQIQLLNISGGISSSLVPQTGSTFDLGSPTNPWRHLYIASASIRFIDGAGTQVATLSAASVNSLTTGTGSFYATTGSNSFNGNQTITGSLNVSGPITASAISLISGTVGNLAYFSTTGVLNTAVPIRVVNSQNTVAIGTNAYNTSQPERLIVDAGTSYNVTTFQSAQQNSYAEVNIKNFGSGSNASTDLVLWNDVATESSSFVDLGINSSNYSASNVGYAGDGYLINAANDLYVGSIFSGSHGHTHLFAGGYWTASAISIYNDNTIGFGTDILNNNVNTIPSSSNGYVYEFLGNTVFDSPVKFQNGLTGQINATNGVVSGSSQVLGGTGIISSSAQLSGTTITNLTITNLTTVNETASVIFSSGSNAFGNYGNNIHSFTGSVQISGSLSIVGASTATSYNGTINATNGVVSGSSQITYASISSIPAGIVSGSAQTIANLPTGVVSGSSQITYASISSIPGGIVSGSSQITYASISSIPGGIVSGSAQTIANLPTGTVSGSSQVTLSSTTGYSTTINQNLLTTSNVQYASLGIGMAASGTAGRIDASGDVVAYSTSDKNFKENIIPIQNALEKISKISGNTYDWKPELKEFHGFEGNDVGVIAQEIEEILPQLVTTRETGYKAVKYDKLVALLIEGIKEQQSQIHNLTLEVENLKKQKGL